MSLNEQLTRFVFDKDHIKGGKAKSAAFKPPKGGEMSVYRTNNLNIRNIWAIGKNYVESLRKDNKQIVGAVHFSANKCKNNKLEINATLWPHPRHANIVGWQSDQSIQKQIQVELALEAVVENRPQ